MIKNFKWLLLVSLAFTACNDDDSTDIVEEPLTAGTADFTRYVALGNSLTAGYSDNALFQAGQENSYPNILAEQFALVGGGTFAIPYMDGNDGGLLLGGAPIAAKRLYLDGFLTTTTPNIINLPGLPTTDILNVLSGPFNNMGVPGAKSYHLLAPGYGNSAGVLAGLANPYFARFASSSGASVLGDAVAQNPTFFSLWIGNNDVLGYAVSGGNGVSQAGNPNYTTYGPNDITDPGLFTATYTALIDQLTNNGAKGVVANIPDVTSIPFFTTVTVKPIHPSAIFNDSGAMEEDNLVNPPVSPTDLETIGLLNTNVYGPLKMILTTLGQGDRIELLSTTAYNPLLITDESLTDLSAAITQVAQASGVPQLVALAPFLGATFGKARQTKTGDYVLLTTRPVIGTNAALPPGLPANLGILGISYPLQDMHILVPSEVNDIKLATEAFNASIESIANANDLAIVDANATMNQLFNGGIRSGSIHVSSSFVSGGAFSLDGIHPGARGYALIANKFLEAINAKYGSNLRPVNIGSYQIQYPAQLN